MFDGDERQALRRELLEAAHADPRLTGGAITGSASLDHEDRWSDIDLAFGVREDVRIEEPLADFSTRMYAHHHALDHLDVRSGTWIYRVFLLSNTLQVDLAFAPATDFGARASTFRLVFGTASTLPHAAPPPAKELIGYAWLYALHTRSSLARGKLWQAEYMLGEMRDHVLALACLRHGLSTREGRGMDGLPAELSVPLQAGLVRSLDAQELNRAFRVVTDSLLRELECLDRDLRTRLEQTLNELTVL